MSFRCCLLAVLGACSDASAAARFSVWPQPAKFEYDANSLARMTTTGFQFISDPKFVSKRTPEDKALLSDAYKRYEAYIYTGAKLAAEHKALPALRSLTVAVARSGVALELGVDESYELMVVTEPSSRCLNASLNARTVWGALRGLETFAQLINEDLLIGGNISVVDAPRYKWRGLLVDTSRHFIPLRTLERAIDGLAAQKMNVLHWHVIDAQSFPLQSKTFPKLAELGAYKFPKATYSPDSVAWIVEYARQRGVRVVLEIETPGHAAAWGHGYPELVVSCPNFMSTFGFTAKIDCVPLDISQNFTYSVVEALLKETAEYVPDGFLHLGGDEVQYGCWNESQNMRDWMAEKGWESFAKAESYWIAAAIGMAKRHGQRRAVVWQESFDNAQPFTGTDLQLPQDAVVHFWHNRSSLPDALNQHHDVLMSEGWYLDLNQPGIPRGRLLDSWIDFYNTNVTDGAEGIDPALVEKHMLGGETCMWGEEVDEQNFETSVFPRSSAVAEKLYTARDQIGGDPTVGQLASKVTQRLEVFRCVLARRGIRAGPVAWPSYCEGAPELAKEARMEVASESGSCSICLSKDSAATENTAGGFLSLFYDRSDGRESRKSVQYMIDDTAKQCDGPVVQLAFEACSIACKAAGKQWFSYAEAGEAHTIYRRSS